MKLKHIGLGIGGIVILSVVWFWWLSEPAVEQGSGVENTVAVDSNVVAGLDSDLAPMYDGVLWGKPAKIEDGEGREVWRVVSGTTADVINIAAVSQPFTEYYHEKLTGAGWEPDMTREASGPGSNVSYYVKDDRFVTIAFDSVFKVQHENAPSECPCDIRFTITSGVE